MLRLLSSDNRRMQDPGFVCFVWQKTSIKTSESAWVTLWSLSKLAYASDKIPMFNGTSILLQSVFQPAIFLLECKLNCWKSLSKKDLVWETCCCFSRILVTFARVARIWPHQVLVVSWVNNHIYKNSYIHTLHLVTSIHFWFSHRNNPALSKHWPRHRNMLAKRLRSMASSSCGVGPI